MAGFPVGAGRPVILRLAGGFVTNKPTNAGAGPHLDVLTILSFVLNRYASIIEFSNMLIDVSYVGVLVRWFRTSSFAASGALLIFTLS